MLSPGVLYTALLGLGLAFALGFIAREVSGKWSFWPLIPYGMALVAGPLWGFWEYLRSKTKVQDRPIEDLEESTEDLEEDDRVLVQHGEDEGYTLEETGSDEPVFLDECSTYFRDINTGAGVHLKRVKVVTAVAFIEAGWKLDFNSADMIGQTPSDQLILDDGRQTPCTRSLWTAITDGMHQAHLIVKEPRKKIRCLHSLKGLLTYTMPWPRPNDFRSWNQ